MTKSAWTGLVASAAYALPLDGSGGHTCNTWFLGLARKVTYTEVYEYSSWQCDIATPLRELTCHVGSHICHCIPMDLFQISVECPTSNVRSTSLTNVANVGVELNYDYTRLQCRWLDHKSDNVVQNEKESTFVSGTG